MGSSTKFFSHSLWRFSGSQLILTRTTQSKQQFVTFTDNSLTLLYIILPATNLLIYVLQDACVKVLFLVLLSLYAISKVPSITDFEHRYLFSSNEHQPASPDLNSQLHKWTESTEIDILISII